MLSKGIIIPSGQPFFRYYAPDSTGALVEIAAASLPVIHTAAIHGSGADTGSSAMTDQIRSIRIQVSGLYRDPRKGDIVRTVQSSTNLLNAGMLKHSDCGTPPVAVTGLTATKMPAGGPYTKVTLVWPSSLDQDSGEKDVERYMVFKRQVGLTDWGQPITTRAAGGATITVDDTQLLTGSWQYAVVAQDCSPTNSSATVSNTITN